MQTFNSHYDMDFSATINNDKVHSVGEWTQLVYKENEYWDKSIARLARVGAKWNILLDLPEFKVNVRLTEKKVFNMRINVLATQQTNSTKREIMRVAMHMFTDWVYNGALDTTLATKINELAHPE